MERERRVRDGRDRDVGGATVVDRGGGGGGGVGGGGGGGVGGSKNVLFNLSKDEAFHHGKGFKVIHKRIRSNFKINGNKEDLSYAKLANNRVIILGGPRKKFMQSELDALKKCIEVGGQSVMILLGEGGESSWDTNINVLQADQNHSSELLCCLIVGLKLPESVRFSLVREAVGTEGVAAADVVFVEVLKERMLEVKRRFSLNDDRGYETPLVVVCCLSS